MKETANKITQNIAKFHSFSLNFFHIIMFEYYNHLLSTRLGAASARFINKMNHLRPAHGCSQPTMNEIPTTIFFAEQRAIGVESRCRRGVKQ